MPTLQGKYEEAEPLYRRAVEIMEATLGNDHPQYAILLDNLAGLLNTQVRSGCWAVLRKLPDTGAVLSFMQPLSLKWVSFLFARYVGELIDPYISGVKNDTLKFLTLNRAQIGHNCSNSIQMSDVLKQDVER